MISNRDEYMLPGYCGLYGTLLYVLFRGTILVAIGFGRLSPREDKNCSISSSLAAANVED
jgi:hypothetical protein